MKRISILALALAVSGTVVAANMDLNPAPPSKSYTSQIQMDPKNTLKRTMLYQTDIAVINGTTGPVHSMVVDDYNNPILDTFLYPETRNDHILHPDWRGNTHVAFVNEFGYPIYNGYVCRLAVISIFGTPNYYRVTIDSTYCSRP